MNTIFIIFSICLVIRLTTLLVSKGNEKRLKANGGMEYGKKISTALAVLHTLYYLSSMTESWLSSQTFGLQSQVGLGIWIISMIMLFLVIKSLEGQWTVKIITKPDQKIINNFLFRYFRHPNYFLNILPELVAITLITGARYTFFILYPIYLGVLIYRIMQEERVMSGFEGY